MKDWKTITKKELYELSFMQGLFDSQIAEMYGVSVNAVSYKRRVKFNLKRQINSDAFRQSCYDTGLKLIKSDKTMSEDAKKLAIKAIKTYYKDLKKDW